MVDKWTSKVTTQSLILSEASRLKLPAGGKILRDEMERSRTTPWGRDLHFCENWEAEEPGQCSALVRPAWQSRIWDQGSPHICSQAIVRVAQPAARAAVFILSGSSNWHANRCSSLHANGLAHKACCHQPCCKKNTDLEI